MEFITAEEASRRWNIGLRTVQRMCASGKIEGAKKISNIWMIPEMTEPSMKKRKESIFEKEIKEAYKAFRQNDMNSYHNFFSKSYSCQTDITKAWYYAVEAYQYYPDIEKMAGCWEKSRKYLGDTGEKMPELSLTMGGHLTLGIFLRKAGMADRYVKVLSEKLPVFEELTGRKSRLDQLFQAELEYQRGHIREAEILGYKVFFAQDSDPDIRLGVSYILAHISMHKGDLGGWKKSVEMVKKIMNENESEITRTSAEIANAELLLALGVTRGVPEWIKNCDFTDKPLTITTRANALYVHLCFLCRNGEFAKGAAFAEMLLESIQEQSDISAYSLLYLYIIMALCYKKLHMEKRSSECLEKVFALAKPDRLYLPFVEWSYDMEGFSDEFLERQEPEIYREVMKIKKSYRKNSVALRASLQELELIDNLTDREKEIIALVAEGMSNTEIAERLYISKSTVNYHINHIFQKLGVNRRAMMVKLLYSND